jgi:hypothetical protein
MKVRNAVVVAALSGPLILLGGESWRDKEPSQWTADEVNQVLTKSPWAREVTASFNRSGMQEGRGEGRGGGMGGGGPMGGGGGPMGEGGGMGGGGPMSGGGWGGRGGMGGGGPMGGRGPMGGGGWGGRRGGMGRNGGEGRTAPKVTVRWESAEPVHDALLKSEVADASKFAEWSKDYYVVTVNGLPEMGQRRRRSDDEDAQQPDPERQKEMRERMEARMKQNTSLKIKDKTIAPERVETIESPGGRTIAFLFPRTANILPGDKEVAFETAMGPLEIHTKFPLKEMAFHGKLEL